MKKQTEITAENISGHGIDVHLLGLRQAAKDNMIHTDLFEDEAYITANHFSLSTSQVSFHAQHFDVGNVWQSLVHLAPDG